MTPHLVAHEVAAGFGFLEGPRFHGGLLYTADHQRREVFRIDPATGATETLCAVPNQPSGLAFTDDGALLITSMLDRRILRYEDGNLTEYADLSAVCLYPINDMTIDRSGRLYVGAFGGKPWIDLSIHPAPITRVDADGSVRVVSTDLGWPNGMVFSTDGTKFYAADTFGCRLAIFDVLDDGGLELLDFYRFAPSAYDNIKPAAESDDFLPDGIALDADGRVWIADAHSPNVAIYDPRTHQAAVVEIKQLNVNVYALAIAPDGTIFACTAPRMNTWTEGVDLPSRMMALTWSQAGDVDALLPWAPSL